MSYNVQYTSYPAIHGLAHLPLLSCLNNLYISWSIFLLMGILLGPGCANDGMLWTVDCCKVDSGDTDGMCHFGLVICAQGCHG